MNDKIIKALNEQLAKENGTVSAAARRLGWKNSGSIYSKHYAQDKQIQLLLVAMSLKAALSSIKSLAEKHGGDVVTDAALMLADEVAAVVGLVGGENE